MDYEILIFVPIFGIPLTIAYLAYRRSQRLDMARMQNRVQERITERHKTRQRVAPMVLDGTAAPHSEPESVDMAHVERLYQAEIDAVERENARWQNGPRSRKPGQCTLNISYVDADGVWTHRNISPYKSGATNDRFDAWCDTRKGRRTFRFEQIQCGTDLRTNRQLSQADVFRIIHPDRPVPPGLE